MDKIASNFFDIQNLTNNTIVFSQTIEKDWIVIIEYQTPEENTIQFNIRIQKLGKANVRRNL